MINLRSKILYIVEGETDKKFIDTIKGKYLHSGQVKVQNPATKSLTRIIRTIAKPTTCILVFDKDVFKDGRVKIDIILNNIKLLSKTKNVDKIIVISQENDLEEELVRATSIKKITELLSSKSNKNVKKDFLNCSNLLAKLEEKNFDLSKIWIKPNLDQLPKNEAKLIKKI